MPTHEAEQRTRVRRERQIRGEVRRMSRHLVKENPIRPVCNGPSIVRVDVRGYSRLMARIGLECRNISKHDNIGLV